MRIALFSSTADARNGYGNITVEYCRALQALDVAFSLFLPAHERDLHERYLPDIPATFCLPPYVFELKNPKSLLYLKPVDVSGFDIVHSLFDFPYCVHAAWSAQWHHKPFMMGSQGTYGVVPLLRWPDRLALEYAYRRAKAIVVPSEYTKDHILQHTKRPYQIDVVHNGVNVARFDRTVDVSGIRNRYPGKKILLTVGGLKERKGQDMVIEALATLRSHTTEFVYLLVGDGEMQRAWQECASKHGVEDHVVFVGSKDGDDLVQYFHACDIYVHTPRVIHYNFEGFGIVYLEAGACGKPSVATDAGGVADAVVHGETGFIVEDGDIGAIADALWTLMKDASLRARMGAAGKDYARGHDWSMIVRRFKAYYLSLLQHG